MKKESLPLHLPEGMTLMRNGAAAFAEILHCLDVAQHSVEIHMFIWREDDIGCRLAESVLEAADRGVKVSICADRYSVPLEYAEESGRSLFHKERSALEKLETVVLLRAYPGLRSGAGRRDEGQRLYHRLLHHPNIRLEKDAVRADHSKYYVFDEETVVLGGVNIEDKENGCDARGVVYQDYMIAFRGRAYVDAFRAYMAQGVNILPRLRFVANRKAPVRDFAIGAEYLHLIRESCRELTVVMAYFAPIPAFMAAITQAAARGVRVRVMVSQSANYQDSKNKKAVQTLLRQSGGRVEVYFSPWMLHTKLVLSDDAVCVGSCNITRKSLYQMGELNITTRQKALVEAIRQDVEKNIAAAQRCDSAEDIRYNALQAWLERQFS